MSIDSVMLSNQLILCHPLPLLPSIFPSIRVFSNEWALNIRWPKYWSFSFSISPSNEYSGLISFRINWFVLLDVQGTLKSLLQHHSSKAWSIWQANLTCFNLSNILSSFTSFKLFMSGLTLYIFFYDMLFVFFLSNSPMMLPGSASCFHSCIVLHCVNTPLFIFLLHSGWRLELLLWIVFVCVLLQITQV